MALTAWEVTGDRPVRDGARRFETIWTVEPDAVRVVAGAAAALASHRRPELVHARAGRLADPPPAPPDLASTTALMNRVVGYLAARG